MALSVTRKSGGNLTTKVPPPNKYILSQPRCSNGYFGLATTSVLHAFQSIGGVCLLGIDLQRFLVVGDGESLGPILLVGFAQRVPGVGRRRIRRHIQLKDANGV